MSRAQNVDCQCERVELTGVTLPAYMLTAMEQQAASRKITVEDLVESAFARAGGVDPCIATP